MPYNFQAKVADPVKAALNRFIAQLPGFKLTLEAEECMGLLATSKPEDYTVVNRDSTVTNKAVEMGAQAVTGEWSDVIFNNYMQGKKFDLIFADFCTTIKALTEARQGALLMADIMTEESVLMITYCNRGVKDTYGKAMAFLQEKYNVLLTVPNRNMLTFVCMLPGANTAVRVTQLLLKSLKPQAAVDIQWNAHSTLEQCEEPQQCLACNLWSSKPVVTLDGEGVVCRGCWDSHCGVGGICAKCDHRPVNGASICGQCQPRLSYNARHLDPIFAALELAGSPLSRAQIESCFKLSMRVTTNNWVNVIRKSLKLFKPNVQFVKSGMRGSKSIAFGQLNMDYFWDESDIKSQYHAVAIDGGNFKCHYSKKTMPVGWLAQDLDDAYLRHIQIYKFN